MSLMGIGCATLAMLYTKPTSMASNMGTTLTETAPGSYLVKVEEALPGVTHIGSIARVIGTDIVLDCAGLIAKTARIKYDGHQADCRFVQEDKYLKSTIHQPDYRPARPSNTTVDPSEGINAEHTFTAARGYITNLGRSKSLLTLPDGREYVITEQPPGEYIDIRVVNREFRSGTLLFK